MQVQVRIPIGDPKIDYLFPDNDGQEPSIFRGPTWLFEQVALTAQGDATAMPNRAEVDWFSGCDTLQRLHWKGSIGRRATHFLHHVRQGFRRQSQ